ncbi:MAG: hypothetical protein NTZ16_05160 [Verrucomicrobia bacterium]|nr:hypothetical protein [Verrucomicrobiota bacterium]
MTSTKRSIILEHKPWLSRDILNLEPVFKKLPKVHGKYIAGESRDKSGHNNEKWTDCTFWYRERTHIGLLAAAVWLAGGIALEEFVTKKMGKHGRGDLWIRTQKPKFSKDEAYWCEAKWDWIDLKHDNPESPMKKIRKSLESAIKDVRGVSSEYNRIAISFYGLGVKKSERKEGGKRLQNLFKEISKTKDFDKNTSSLNSYFWIGLKEGHTKKSYTHFGVLIALRLLKPKL